MFHWSRIENFPWTIQSDQYFPIIWEGGGVTFFFEPLYLENY